MTNLERVNYEGWRGSIRLANGAVELVATTVVGPRIMHLSAAGGRNLFRVEESLKGTIAAGDKWVNYGGHRLWHAPEIFPRTYAPDNEAVQASTEGEKVVLKQATEPSTGIQKTMSVTVAGGSLPAALVEHRLTNRNVWPVSLAPWALSVVAPGGRVILPQARFQGHGEGNNFLPARPIVMWPFTDMTDSRWTWGARYIQLRTDASIDRAQKAGAYSDDGWGAYVSADGDLFVIFVEPDPRGPAAFTDMGCNFEAFTKADFQEMETLGPVASLQPGEDAVHVERWVVFPKADLPADDAGLAAKLPDLIAKAKSIGDNAFGA